MPFDPNAAAQPGSGLFGLPFSRGDARLLVLPVPFDATTSYGGGASAGPEAVLRASAQVDLFDLQFGRVYEPGIFMDEASEEIASLSKRMRKAAEPIIEKGGADDGDRPLLHEVARAGERVNQYTHAWTKRALEEGRIPGLLGGDHSTPFGAIRACAEAAAGGMGILQIDAHMDLREAFEGFRWSHASIMWNVLKEIPGVSRLVQVGIRDFGEGEFDVSRASGGRVVTHFDLEWQRAISRGGRFDELCARAIEPLPEQVYVSFDIDGLDPSMCPHTGTPVPGGLSFAGACLLLEALARSGRTIVGFDLNEVCPAASGDDEWDANVGARVLYKLCGAALASHGAIKPYRL